jgi:lipooligosaccharide transport system permease protein
MTSAPLREFSYCMTHYRRTWRGTVVTSVANPLLFLAALGSGLGTLVDRNSAPALHGVPYLAFLAPGLLAAATMQNAVIESTGPVYHSARGRGNYRSAAVTPMRPFDIFQGHLLFMTFRVAISAAAFVVVMLVFGLARTATGALLLVPAATLTGVAFAAPLAAWSIAVRRPVILDNSFRFVIMPLYLLSGTLFSLEQLPQWLRPVAWATPLWHGVELCRALSLGTITPGATALHVGYLLVLVVGGIAAGRITYRRQLHL